MSDEPTVVVVTTSSDPEPEIVPVVVAEPETGNADIALGVAIGELTATVSGLVERIAGLESRTVQAEATADVAAELALDAIEAVADEPDEEPIVIEEPIPDIEPDEEPNREHAWHRDLF